MVTTGIKINKKLIGLILFTFFMTMSFSTSFATAPNMPTPFQNIYTTDDYGSTIPMTVFGLSETPWLYMQAPAEGFFATGALLLSPSGLPYTLTGIQQSGDDIWLSFGSQWPSIMEVGIWSITAGYNLIPQSVTPVFYGTGETSFTVTPEPVSSILFLTGGAFLAGRRFLRKRKQ